MRHFRDQKLINYDKNFITDIVMDIERYPEFLPWCQRAKILSKTNNETIAELTISFKGFVQSYVSKILIDKNPELNTITIESIRGPLSYLKNIWQIKQQNNSALIDFSIDFQFKSMILDMVTGLVFSLAINKIIVAFENRAQVLSSFLKNEEH